MSMEEREDPTKAPDEDVEGHASKVREAAKVRNTDDESDDVEGHASHTRDALDEGDDVEGHASRTR
jgi:hypothetical protein